MFWNSRRANSLHTVRPAERRALPASGRVKIRFGSGKNLKPGKGLKNAQSPTCRVHAVLGACLDRLDNRSPNADFLLDNNNQTHLDQILPPMKTLEITEKVQSTRNLVKLSLVDVVKHRYTNKLRTYLQYQRNMDSKEANPVLAKCARPRRGFYKHD